MGTHKRAPASLPKRFEVALTQIKTSQVFVAAAEHQCHGAGRVMVPGCGLPAALSAHASAPAPSLPLSGDGVIRI
jgi:thiamine pyrophosphate-dependent acetolactate synthase large subunit-like protein